MIVQIFSDGHAGGNFVVLHCYRDCRHHVVSVLRTYDEHYGYVKQQTLRHTRTRRRQRYFCGVLCHAHAYIRRRLFLHRVTIRVTRTREIVSAERVMCIDIRSNFG